MATERKPEMDRQAVEEVYRRLGTPGKQHALLARMEGSWTTRTRSWSSPGAAPEESAGVCEQKMILGGRFLQQECAGEMMGGKFTGIGVTGFDNHTRKFVSTWIDSMGTALWVFEGPASPDGKSFEQRCSYDDPVKGQTEFRSVSTLVDDNRMSFEMYGTVRGGREEKMMEMTYTRKA